MCASVSGISRRRSSPSLDALQERGKQLRRLMPNLFERVMAHENMDILRQGHFSALGTASFPVYDFLYTVRQFLFPQL